MGDLIYLDNAATTFPKPEIVYKTMDFVNRNMAVNVGRGDYSLANEAFAILNQAKEKMRKLVNALYQEDVVFTPSATIACNQILRGLPWRKGDNVYVSPFEHNAVIRVLYLIQREYEINIIQIPLNPSNLKLDLDKLEYLFKKKPPFCLCITQMSNVTGYILPIDCVVKLAKKYHAVTIVDVAQSLGVVPINLEKNKIDFLVFTGHKSLYGSLGVGGMIRNSWIDTIPLKSFLAGGTGSDSLSLKMPKEYPYQQEFASLNIVAIAGLEASLSQIIQASNKSIYLLNEWKLIQELRKEFEQIEQVILYVPTEKENHIGILSFNVKGYKAYEVGMILDEEFKIAVRTGYHCTPYIHEWIHDKEYCGTVRVSISKFTRKEEIKDLVSAVSTLLD